MSQGPKKLHDKLHDSVLENTSVDSHFAMASTTDQTTFTTIANPDFGTLVAPLGVLPGGPYDYAYVDKSSSGPHSTVEVGASLAALNGIIATGNGKDTVDMALSTGTNLVMAGNGHDNVVGGLGADTVLGGNGKDDLLGGAGDDALNGGTGKDHIVGGADTGVFSSTTDLVTGLSSTTFVAGDVLTGGEGKDVFEYAFGDGVDEITDFHLGQDSIAFDGISESDLVSFTDGVDLYIGLNDGVGGLTANSVVRVDGVTDMNELLNQHSLLFV